MSVKSYNLKNYIKMLEEKELNNPRNSEFETLCTHWKNYKLYHDHENLLQKVNELFAKFFEIKYILFGNI